MSSYAVPNNILEYQKNQEELMKALVDNQSLPIPSQYESTRQNSTDYSEMAKSILVGVSAMIPVVGNAVSIFTDAIWSLVSSNQNPSENELYGQYSQMIKLAIDQSIDTYDNAAVKGVIAEIKTYIDKFYIVRKDWQLTPNNATKKSAAGDAFDDLEDVLRGHLVPNSTLRKQGYEAQELAFFTFAATTHLLLLKDGIANGKKWKLTDAVIEEYKSYYSSSIVEYSKHCKIAFDKGVEKCKNLPIDGQLRFNKLMNFRSYSARFCFDYVNTWLSFDQVQFPNGLYIENVRYLFGDLVGRIVDNSKTAYTGSPYYYPDVNFIEDFFIKKELELYKKELKRVEVVNDNYWIYAIQPFFKDPNFENSERAGEKAGNQVKTGGIIFSFPSSAQKTSFDGKFDVPPRRISIPGTVSPNYPSVTLDIGNSKSTYGQANDTELDYIHCHAEGYSYLGRPIPTSVDIPNHKIGFIRGHDINNEVYTFDTTPFEKHTGILDCIIVGAIPTNIFNENYLFPNICTAVNAQKFFFRDDPAVTFARDHVLPTIHSMNIPVDKRMRFQFKFVDKTIKKYTVAIRYHLNADNGKIIVRNAAGVDIGTPLILERCSTDTINQYKIAYDPTKIIDFATMDKNQITIMAKQNNVYVHSLLFYPYIEPTTTTATTTATA